MMQINNTLPVYSPFSDTAGIERKIPVQTDALSTGKPRQGVIVDISPEAQAAYKKIAPGESESGQAGAMQKIAALEPTECETCKNRKYKDVSNDPSVSFQTPTHMSPGQSASGVLAHENEHVSHEQAKAARNDRRVVSQSVTLRSSICPECGTIYISGGVTRTVTAENTKSAEPGSLVDEIA
jgi:hypothetical protein